MEKQYYTDIEWQRLRRHNDTIASMGYLISLLLAFSENPFGDPMINVNFYILILSSILLIFTIVFNWSSPAKNRIELRILINTVIYIMFITCGIFLSGERSLLLYFLYYLVFIGALLTLSRRQLLFEIGFITVCIIIVTIHQGLHFSDILNSLVYQLIPFWVIAYVGAEIYQQAQEAKHQLERLSLTDTLTGMWNVRTFNSFLDREIDRSERYEHIFALMMLDVDNLKQINDTHGHLVGSAMIRHTGTIIINVLRKTDIAARFGGDEFVLLLPETDQDDAIIVGERICRAIHTEAYQLNNYNITTSVSIGIATFPVNGSTPEELISNADRALYRSKKSGKNRVSLYNPAHYNEKTQHLDKST